MWKLEKDNIFIGGKLSWYNNIRIKHITSGKYLKGNSKY